MALWRFRTNVYLQGAVSALRRPQEAGVAKEVEHPTRAHLLAFDVCHHHYSSRCLIGMRCHMIQIVNHVVVPVSLSYQAELLHIRLHIGPTLNIGVARCDMCCHACCLVFVAGHQSVAPDPLGIMHGPNREVEVPIAIWWSIGHVIHHM